MTRTALVGAAIFDGTALHDDHALLLEDDRILDISPTLPAGFVPTMLDGGVLAPGLLDLQVNGGGGLMVGPDTDTAMLDRICATHAALGATGILPTLITDSPATTARVIEAAVACRHPGLAGLHLEGPHLDPRRKGAHDPALIRPMTDADCDLLVAAAGRLPALMVTLAPASASLEQIARLDRAAVIVSLGHAEATHADATAAMAAGARCVTHLFNAMSQLGHREPGMVGAALTGQVHAGLIADGHHSHLASLRLALAARPDGLFLVTDAMAVAGTDADHFMLNGRKVWRHDGRLVLEDGTLAGADLTLPRAIALLVHDLGTPLVRALAMATSIPATLIGADARRGHIAPGRRADLVHLGADLDLRACWLAGTQVAQA